MLYNLIKPRLVSCLATIGALVAAMVLITMCLAGAASGEEPGTTVSDTVYDQNISTENPNTVNIDPNLTSGGSISGRVLDGQGNPLAGISINCEGIDGPGGNGTETSADGTYTVNGLPYGNYKVSASNGWGTNDNNWVRQWYIGKLVWDQADIVTISAGSPNAANIDFVLTAGGSISGKVIDQATGGPPKDATIGSIELGNGWHKIIYRFEECEGASDARAGFKAPGDADWRIFSTSELTIRTAPETGAQQGILLTTGKNNSDHPQNHGQMLACVDLESTQEPGWYGQSPVQEIYQQENIHGCSDYFTARYEAYFFVPDALAGTWRFSTDSDDASEIMIDDQVVAYWYGGHGSAGRWAGKGRVSAAKLIGVDSEGYRQFGESNDTFIISDGSYTLSGLQPGLYGVYTDISGYSNQVYNGIFRPFANPDNVSLIEVTAGEEKSGIDFAVNHGGGIAGRVSDTGGNPVPWANVAVYINFNGSFITNDRLTTRADSSGNYDLFGFLISGEYKVRAWASGLGMRETGPVVVTAPQTTSGIDLVLEPCGTVSGIVRDEQGNPLAGIGVNCEWVDGDGGNGTETGADGTYTITGLPYGNYRVSACDGWGTNDSGWARQWYNRKLDWDHADILTISAENPNAANINFILGPGGSISGVVRDEQGNPLAGISVNCWSDEDSGYGTKTGEDGTYTVYCLPFGNYKISAPVGWGPNDSNWAQQWYNNKPDWEQAGIVSISAGSPNAANINLILELGGTISGVICDQQGSPIGGADVWAEHWNGDWAGGTRTDEHGNFTIPGLSTGEYRVGAQAPGYVKKYYQNTLQYDEATPVIVTAGNNTSNINFTLVPGGTVSGIVRDEQGHPLAGISVNCDWIDGDGGNGTETDEDGTYTISGLPYGNYRVSACDGWGPNDSGWTREWYNGKPDGEQADTVTISAESPNTANINFTLEPGGIISGVVRDGQGNPLAGIGVSCERIDGDGGNGTETGADGTYKIIGLPYGDYKLIASNGGGMNDSNWARQWYSGAPVWDQADIVTISAGSPNAVNINFSLVQGASISGIVKDELGNPIADAHVWADYWNGDGTAGDITDENGIYTIQRLPAGEYIVCARAGGRVQEYYQDTLSYDEATHVIVTAGNNISNINFVLEPGGTVSGVVKDEQGNPIAGVSVSCGRIDGDGGNGDLTGADGTYTVSGLPYGSYKLRAPDGNGPNNINWASQWYNGKLGWDQADIVTISAESPNAVNINFILAEGSSISGRVLDEQNNPIAGADVWVEYWNGEWAGGTSTNENGNYAIQSLPAGEYRVAASAPGRLVKFYQNTVSYDQAAKVVVVTGVDTQNINFTLEPGVSLYFDPPDKSIGVGEELTISLIVQDAVNLYGADIALTFDPSIIQVADNGLTIGSAIDGIAVTNSYDNVNGRINVVSTRVGTNNGFNGTGEMLRFTVKGINPGVSNIGYSNIALSDGESHPILFNISAGRVEVVEQVKVSGKVSLQGVDGYAGGVQVRLINQAGGVAASVESDSSGSYLINRDNYGNAIPAGTYFVTFSKPVYLTTASGNFTLNANSSYIVPDIELKTGDIDGNNTVNILDLVNLAVLYGQTFTWDNQVNWYPNSDLNRDNVINLFDLVLLAVNFGESSIVSP